MVKKQIIKYLFSGGIVGVLYTLIEIFYRGYSHWTMFLLGGICFILLGLINEVLSWGTPIWKQALIGGAIITTLEFIVGCIINLWLGWDIWHYDKLDILGQICIPFFFVWCVLSIIGIILDDYIRYWFFNEKLPRYQWK